MQVTITIKTPEALLNLLSIPGVELLIPTTPSKIREQSAAKRLLPSGNLLYKKGAGPRRIIDIDASLQYNRVSRADILSRSWKDGTWQNSLKRAIGRE